MTYQPPQQPPVMHGYPAQPPNNDWKPPPAKKRGPLPWLIGTLVVLVLGMGGLLAWITFGADSDEKDAAAGPTLTAAKNTCGANSVTMADGDKTMVIDSTGDEDLVGLASASVQCILTNLGAPVAVTQHMDSTRSIDGRQTATWPGFSASWTYHPDDGLDLIITATS